MSTFYPWSRAIASLALATLGSIGLYIMIVALKPVAADFGVSRSAASLAYAAMMLGLGVGGIFMGWLSDRVGVMWPSMIGAACLSLGLLVAGTTDGLWIFIGAHGLLIGLLGNSALMVPLVADITRWFDANRGVAVAIVISGNYCAGALWPPIVQYGIDTVGWRDTYQWLAGVCLIGMVPLSLALWRRAGPDLVETSETAVSKDRPMGFTPFFAQCFLCTAGVGCCVAMAVPQAHLVAHASDLGHAAARGAEMLSLMLAFGVLSRLGFGWLSDRIGGMRTVIVGSVMQTIVIAAFIPITGLSALYWASALFGLSQGGIVPAYAIIIRRHFPATDIGWRVGIMMLFTLVGMGFGGWIAGVLYDLTGSYRVAFFNAIAFNILNVVIAFVLLAKVRFAKRA